MSTSCRPRALAAIAVLLASAFGSAPVGSQGAAAAAAQPPAAEPAPTYADREPLGVAMEGWIYPAPVRSFAFELRGQPVRMAYMDVAPAAGVVPRGAVLLMHGKNFGSDYWAPTLRALSAAGYRVIAPDQIGFGRSSKPEIDYSFGLLAEHTARLLDHLQLPRVALVANSMGGMLAVHFTRAYPQRVQALVLENPLGLEDYRASIPPQRSDNLVKLEMAQTPASYRAFLKSYFPNWQAAQEALVEQFARVQLSSEYPRFARVSAATYQMIFDGPIVDELPRLDLPTLLAIGQLDRTVFGRRFAPPEAVKALGNFPQLGRQAQALIPGSRLVAFEGVGHVPHLEAPERFHAALLDFLAGVR